MRKITVYFLLFALVFFVFACGSHSKNNENKIDSDKTKTDSDETNINLTDDDILDDSISDNDSKTDMEADNDADAVSEEKDDADSGLMPDNDEAETTDKDDSDDFKSDDDIDTDILPDSDGDADDLISDDDIEPSVEPCNPNPCETLANSTGECVQTGTTGYSCTCKSGFNWTGTQCKGVSSIPVPLGNICTGQTKCYDYSAEIVCPSSGDFYGQDSQYAEWGACTPKSFSVQTVNGDKIVVDNNTGLEWQQSPGEGSYNWQEAQDYCRESTYAGFSDWRLPTPHEILTIADNGKSNPAIDTTIFKNMPTEVTGSFWTSKAYQDGTFPRRFDSYDGCVAFSDKADLYYAICVRGDELPSGGFVVSGSSDEPVVTDVTTGLVWQKIVPKTQYTWLEAFSHCENLTYAGSSNWRLPNKNELASLVSFNLSKAPYSDFPEVSDLSISNQAYGHYWSSSTSSYYNLSGWEVHFNVGSVYTEYKTQYKKYYVRCVYGLADNNPCDNNPCPGFSNSTGECRPISKTFYVCGCSDGYHWRGTDTGCVEEVTIGNICTGQTTCSDNGNEITCPSSEADFYGQDAQYAASGACKPQSFTVKTVSGQNIVVDNNTGLEWQQILDETATYTWEGAQNYCSGLNYAGYSSGWRVPTPQELLTLVDNNKYWPAINTTIFPNMTKGNYIWTSKSKDDNNGRRFSPFSGTIGYELKTFAYYAMCVHGKEMPNGVFTKKTIYGKDVLIDSTTGLMWQKPVDSIDNRYTWQEALKYCTDSDYAGYSDWRLPNRSELTSLVNYDKSESPYSNLPYMPRDVGINYFWTSTTLVTDDGRESAWFWSFYTAGLAYDTKISTYNVICVR
jgi:hypothetical protein